ncbi:helix-turn-helix transcriptional regulator [Variovorax sp. PAMC26660]|uniref:helix-turn-helix transcriptional regulator n=1 Tax=Variovorax sp. PAMC26660 TaxID=2762322 RepID=UPI00164DF657|nr:AraC family transcriptional regulator [Variovorax sp. PAMC26660]QNK65406.1 helix-turn-helix transcriptional regulator [Variovorax sp. PAMC26660]
MSLRDLEPGVRSTLQNGLPHSHFSVQAEPPRRQLLAWRDRVGHVIDVLPSSRETEMPFRAAIDRYSVGDIVFTDCRSDAMVLERSLARISTDTVRDYAFHLFLEGDVEGVTVRHSATRHDASSAAKILALDMGQPVRMRRNACHVLTFFVPGTLVEEIFPDPEAIHGRTMQGDTPIARLAMAHIAALGQDIATLSAPAAHAAVRAGAQLLIAGFGKQAQLSGNARAAARAAMFGQVRRYVQANLHRADLSPESVLTALRMPRPTLYRMFQHEGGLGAYIRHLRLRHAADDLIRYPHLMVTDVAYGVGFKSPSDFTRAFRRAYDLSPRDFRASSGKAA